jgi:hypothetical protein
MAAGPLPQYPSGIVISLGNYRGKWTIPDDSRDDLSSIISEPDESIQEGTDCSSFAVPLAREVTGLAGPSYCLSKLSITIGAAYQMFLQEQSAEDCPTLRSKFRIAWWRRAKAHEIEIW